MQVHLLSFEGPDDYARAGGIATRVSGLAGALADAGQDTHLWFIGDPRLPGEERRDGIHLHRWCQWISSYHPAGVYDGEEGKRLDYVASLPPHLMREVLVPALAGGEQALILAEEWHTVDAVLHLDWLLRKEGLRERVAIHWNANNTYSFERIDWRRLSQAATITTVSRYMKCLMRASGVDALVIANGLAPHAFAQPERGAVAEFRRRLRGRGVLAKVARFHPDKRWPMAVETVAVMKRLGWRPLLVARGGMEAYGGEVLSTAANAGLRIVEQVAGPGACGLIGALARAPDADILNLRAPLDEEAGRLLFHGADAVLANSLHEPFGLVGLETMAVGGVACTGASGEDYVVPGHNALVLETDEPREFITLFDGLRSNAALADTLRRAGRLTASLYAWPQIVRRALLPRLAVLAGGPSRATVAPTGPGGSPPSSARGGRPHARNRAPQPPVPACGV